MLVWLGRRPPRRGQMSRALQVHAGWATAATLVNANLAFSAAALQAGASLLIAAYVSVRELGRVAINRPPARL